jgi:hypothetical protein
MDVRARSSATRKPKAISLARELCNAALTHPQSHQPAWLVDQNYNSLDASAWPTYTAADRAPRIPGYEAIPRDGGAELRASAGPTVSTCDGSEETISQCFRAQLVSLVSPAADEHVVEYPTSAQQVLIFACSNSTSDGTSDMSDRRPDERRGRTQSAAKRRKFDAAHAAAPVEQISNARDFVVTKHIRDGTQAQEAASAMFAELTSADAVRDGTWVIGDRLPNPASSTNPRHLCSHDLCPLCDDDKRDCTANDVAAAAAALRDITLRYPRVFLEVRMSMLQVVTTAACMYVCIPGGTAWVASCDCHICDYSLCGFVVCYTMTRNGLWHLQVGAHNCTVLDRLKSAWWNVSDAYRSCTWGRALPV